MTIPEQAVQAAANAAHEELLSMAKQMNVPMEYTQSISVSNYRVMRAALTAAAPHLAAVQVKDELSIALETAMRGEFKALHWHDVEAVCSWCYAKTPVGEYSITWSFNERGQKLHYPDGTTKQFDGIGYGDRDAAKAAAQADYEARILSALEPSAGRADVLEEAAKIAFDVSENGEYHGEASVDSASSIYQQGAYEVYEAIRALHPQADKPSDDGAQGEGWLPIESAPKDGGFLAANSTKVWAAWHYDSPNWHARYGSRGATHWRPLPTPPAGEVA